MAEKLLAEASSILTGVEDYSVAEEVPVKMGFPLETSGKDKVSIYLTVAIRKSSTFADELLTKTKEERLKIAENLMKETGLEKIDMSVDEIRKLDETLLIEKTKSGFILYYIEND